MKIFKQKHINNVDVIIREAGSENPIMLMVSIEKLNKKEIEKAGFTQPFEAGKKVAPPAIGPKTKENIHGRSFPLRDKPKMEKTYSYYRSFFDWHGNEHFAVFSVKRMVYSRREEPGFCENLSIKIINGEKCISTGFIDYKKDPKRLLNAANVMLECFGEFWIGGKNQIAIQSIKTENPINLSWTIFPKGEPIGERLVSEIAPWLSLANSLSLTKGWKPSERFSLT